MSNQEKYKDVPKTCERCGKFFFVTRWASARGRGRFCSRSCAAHQFRGANGLYKTDQGYIRVLKGDKYPREHRLLMEKVIGRPLRKDEIVHHKNEIKDDNRLDNLEVMTRSEHIRFHNYMREFTKWSRKYDKCIRCGTTDSKHAGQGLCRNCYGRDWYSEYGRKKGTK